MDRTQGIGGSDVGAICGINKYKTPLDVYMEKIGDKKSDVSNRYIKIGIAAEPLIANEYENITGYKCEAEEKTLKIKKHPFMMAHIDRWVIDNKNRFVLECKWSSLMRRDEWGKEGTDEIPEEYLCQVAHYAIVTNCEFVDIAVWIGMNEFRIYRYNRNPSFEKAIIDIEEKFWNENVIKKIPPEPITKKDLWIFDGKSKIEQLQAPLELENKYFDLLHIKEEIKDLEQQKELLEFEIKKNMGNISLLTDLNNKKLCTWKPQNRKTFNTAKFKEDNPELYKKYIKENTSRIFKIYK